MRPDAKKISDNFFKRPISSGFIKQPVEVNGVVLPLRLQQSNLVFQAFVIQALKIYLFIRHFIRSLKTISDVL